MHVVIVVCCMIVTESCRASNVQLRPCRHSDRPARRTALVAAELKRYNIDIAALSETRLPDEGSLTEVGEGYTFLWKGRSSHSWSRLCYKDSSAKSVPRNSDSSERKIDDTTVASCKEALHDGPECLCPNLTSDEDSKDRFYESLLVTLRSIPRSDKIIILGDFNARVGSNHHIWKGIIGRHGMGNINSNGFRLLNLCC